MRIRKSRVPGASCEITSPPPVPKSSSAETPFNLPTTSTTQSQGRLDHIGRSHTRNPDRRTAAFQPQRSVRRIPRSSSSPQYLHQKRSRLPAFAVKHSLGSDLVLEPERPRTEARGLQSVLQPISLSHRTDRGDTGAAERCTRATARALRLLSLATALQELVSDPSCCLNWNSPYTGSPRASIRRI